MKDAQKDINWITGVLDHDINELKETLEAVQALRVDEERAVTYSDLAAGKREAQAKLLERVKNLAEYAYKVCVRRNETYTPNTPVGEPETFSGSTLDVDWVPITIEIQCESPEVARGIYDRRENAFTLEDFTPPSEANEPWKLYRAVFKNQLHNDKFSRVMGETLYGWVKLPANEPMMWRKEGISGMIEGAPCVISEISLINTSRGIILLATAMLPFQPDW